MSAALDLHHKAAVIAECRASADSSGAALLSGYAAVWHSPTTIAGAWVEEVAETAFDKALADIAEGRTDVTLLVDHDPACLLCRTRSGTLKLEKDAHGLRFEAKLPDTTLAHDVAALVRSGSIYGCSFAFLPRKDGETWQGNRRTLRDVELFDVSVVRTQPAYSATEVSVRAKQEADKRRREYVLAAI